MKGLGLRKLETTYFHPQNPEYLIKTVHCAASKEKRSLLWFNTYSDLIDIMILRFSLRNAAA